MANVTGSQKSTMVYRKLLLTLASAGYLLLLCGNLLTRVPWVDEIYVANPAWNLVTHGSMGTTTIEMAGSAWTNIDKHTYNTFPLGILNIAAFYKIFGVSLFSTRLSSIFWGAILLAALYRFLRANQASWELAATATLLLAIDYNFMLAATFARLDMMCAALGFCGLAAFSILRPHRPAAAVLVACSFAALSLSTHPNGILFIPALVFVEVIVFRWSLPFKTTLLAVVPFAVAGGAMALYMAQDWHGAVSQIRANSYPGRLTGFLHPFSAVYNEITGRYLTSFGLTLGEHPSGPVRARGLILLAYILGLAATFWFYRWRQTRYLQLTLALLTVFSLYFTFFDGTRFSYYMVLVTPFWCTLLAGMLVHLWAHQRKTLAALILSGLMVLQLGGILYRSLQNPLRKTYMPAVEYLQAHAAPTDLVFGNSDFAFGYGYSRNMKEEITLGYRSKLNPEYLVIDPSVAGLLQSWVMKEPEIYRFMDARLQSYTPVYEAGGYKIYRRPATVPATLNP